MRIGAKLYHIRFGMWRNGIEKNPAPFTKIVKSAAPEFSADCLASPLEMHRAMIDNRTAPGSLASN
jgi:hypothetical protein